MFQKIASWADWLADQRSAVVLVDHPGEAEAYRHGLARQQAGTYLETVRVLPKAQWLVELWDNSFPSRQVLRPVQLLVLAEKIVVNSTFIAEAAIGVQGIAQRFVDAFELAERYQLDVSAGSLASNEQQAFQHWREQLLAQLDEQAALSAAQLPAALLRALEAGQLELPERLALSAALEISPGERALLAAIAQAGVESCSLSAFGTDKPPASAIRQYRAADVREEVRAAVQWVAARLDAGEDPAPRLALVAPDIRPYEEPLRRALERQLYPFSLFPAAAPGASLAEPWRIGTGRLAAYPVVAAALDLLLVAGAQVPQALLSRVLLSPFVAGAEIWSARRAQLDWRWREQLPGQTTLRRALQEARYAGFEEAIDGLVALEAEAAQHKTSASPSEWVKRFDRELLVAGWPNREAGDPVLDQCRQGFSQVMDTLRALDRQLGAIDRGTALHWLQHVLTGKRFELQRDQAPPLQLLSLEEASGQDFDALWILGLSDAVLPRAVEPSPFLPREQLIAAGVPRADHGDALRRDRELLQAVMAAAAECVVSVAAHGDDGVPQSACSLLAWNGRQASCDAAPAFSLDARLSWPTDDPVRAVSAAEKERLRGGTGLFKAYAASPFFAFLKYRLGLSAFPEPVEGLEPKVQGAWVHRALELFWRDLGNSDALAALADDEIEARLRDSIDRATSDGVLHGDELLRIEKRRLQSLLRHWLRFEKNRDEAFVVEATEQRGRVDAFGIPLTMQIDRIDRIGEHRVVIDYKTGTVAANALNADNLLEPQLPLYALLAEDFAGPIDGVVLAQVHARDGMKVHMRSNWCANLVSKTVKNPVDTPEKWQAERAAWTRVLQTYAAGFLSGDIAHDYQLDASAFRFDPYVATLARLEFADDD